MDNSLALYFAVAKLTFFWFILIGYHNDMLTKFDHVALLVKIFQGLATTYRIKDVQWKLARYPLLHPQLWPDSFQEHSSWEIVLFPHTLRISDVNLGFAHDLYIMKWVTSFWQILTKGPPITISQKHLDDLNKAFRILHNFSPMYLQYDFSKYFTQATQIYSLSFLEACFVLCNFFFSPLLHYFLIEV